MNVEAVSNVFLPDHRQLDEHQQVVLLSLGWHAISGDEFPNYHRWY